MRLGVKHQNQFQIVHADFSGGLNTSTSVDGIAENQLSRATNVEVDHATGKLRTVAGTIDVLKFENLFAAAYDEINRKLLLVDADKKVYAFDVTTKEVSGALGTLSGEYPNWQMSEVSRNVEVSGRLSTCAVSDSVFVLGKNEVQNIQTTNAYGDMKPQNIAILIESEIKKVSKNSLLRYVPKLNQVWILNGESILIFDLVTQSWYKRQFNSRILDVISIDDDVYIIKPDRVSKLSETSFCDSGEELTWDFKCKRRISHYDFFLKRTAVSFTPLNENIYMGQIRAGAVVVDLPIINRKSGRRQFVFSKGEPIYRNYEPIYGNLQPIFNRPTIIAESRNVYRNKFLDIEGRGTTGGIIFNSITLDLVEV